MHATRPWLASLVAAALAAGSGLRAAEPAPRTPGPQADGSVILPNQWSLRPAGRQLEVGDFPAAIALHPDGRHAVVLHCGYGPHELAVLDIESRKLVSRTRLADSFQGLAFSRDGSRVWVSGGAAEILLRFRFVEGALVPDGTVRLRDEKLRGIPCGIGLADDGTLYVANVWGHSVSRIRFPADAAEPVVDELLLTAEAPKPGPAIPDSPEPSITKRAEALLERAVADAPHPWTCVVDDRRGRLYVSLWGQASVAVIDTRRWAIDRRITVEDHPNEMLLTPDGSRLFVANANRNSVSAIDLESGAVEETLVATLTADAPPGNTPNSLALSADGRRLFVSNANINAVSVWDVAERGRARSLGFIPVGWYPTAVRLAADGGRLLVANGKGVISDSNRNGPRPGYDPDAPTPDYIGGLFDGTVSFIDLPEDGFEKRLKAWTARALACRPPRADDMFTAAELEGHPIPLRPGQPSPITHVIYVVKENRTYDQVFGDMPEGRGDPTLCLFPETVTPNHHALARQFVLLDNFYVESEVSADGHEWSMGAYATDFVERHWPMSYGHNQRKKFTYPSEGNFPIARPAGGYLWDRALAAGVSFRSYGEWVANGPGPEAPGTAKAPALEGHFDPLYRSFDQEYSDLKRADRFLAELARFEREGEMPRLQIVRLPNDHTSGSKPGALTPTAFMAENDLALGRMVEAVSRTKYWPSTAIFVVEDDAQNGSDHIDAHRTVALVISPWTRHGAVDSSLYSTSSMLRTIELILGLEPMSQFDAAALPMVRSFAKQADATPYRCRPATVPLDTRNASTAWGAAASVAMDFSKEDAADDLLLNEIVWRSVRGAESPMPPPRRAAFVFVADSDDDDDHDDDHDDPFPVTAVPAAERQRLSLAASYAAYVRAAGGIPVVASAAVHPAALAEAAWLIDVMLAKRPDVAAAIGRSPVRFVVMAHDERTTDVPEHADLEPRDYWDRRARGLGATLARPATSCGEENLLCFPGDPYSTENILIHEFAHTIHQIGLEQVDPTFEPRLRAAFAEAQREGRWADTYARENPAEYWAEGVQSWFSCNRTHDREHGAVNSPAAVAEHDPPLAALLAEVFGEAPWPYVRPHDRAAAERRHLGGFDRDEAPRFEWDTRRAPADAQVSGTTPAEPQR